MRLTTSLQRMEEAFSESDTQLSCDVWANGVSMTASGTELKRERRRRRRQRQNNNRRYVRRQVEECVREREGDIESERKAVRH